MKRALSLILVALMALMLVPAIGVAAADDAVVYLNGTTGADTNDGKTAATAVATFGKAVEVANTFADAAEVTVVVTGETAIPEAQYVLPESAKPIVVTSVYGGTDYKAQGAQFITHDSNCAAIHFNGKFTFENITIKTTNKNSIFSLQYNSFTAGEGGDFVTVLSADASTSYPLLRVGCNTQGGVPNDKAITPTTFTDDVTVEVNSGTWAYVLCVSIRAERKRSSPARWRSSEAMFSDLSQRFTVFMTTPALAVRSIPANAMAMTTSRSVNARRIWGRNLSVWRRILK